MSPAPLLEASALSMWRGDRCLFRDLDLDVQRGQALHVRGPNGCGKTTLLRILCGLTTPDGGVLQVEGTVLRGPDPVLRSRVTYLGHADGLKQELTVTENLRFAAALAGAPPGADDLAVLERLGIASLATLQTRFLSAGQRRRLAIARVLVTQRELWLMDEPFTSLDVQGCELLTQLMGEALEAGVGIVFTNHQAAALDADRVRTLDLAPATA